MSTDSHILVKPYLRYNNSYSNNFFYRLCDLNTTKEKFPINYYGTLQIKNCYCNSCLCSDCSCNNLCDDPKQESYYRRLTNCVPVEERQYQTQKRIFKTVSVPSSLYSMNLAALNVYQKSDDSLRPNGVNWNQMSDRPLASVQKAYMPSRGNSSRTSSAVKGWPGSMSPGGAGCDVKHGSYDRYLNRLKGKSNLRSSNTLNKSRYNIVSGCVC